MMERFPPDRGIAPPDDGMRKRPRVDNRMPDRGMPPAHGVHGNGGHGGHGGHMDRDRERAHAGSRGRAMPPSRDEQLSREEQDRKDKLLKIAMNISDEKLAQLQEKNPESAETIRRIRAAYK